MALKEARLVEVQGGERRVRVWVRVGVKVGQGCERKGEGKGEGEGEGDGRWYGCGQDVEGALARLSSNMARYSPVVRVRVRVRADLVELKHGEVLLRRHRSVSLTATTPEVRGRGRMGVRGGG